MKFKLLAIDCDDTLLNTECKLEKSTVAMIKKVRERGVGVTLATGRMFKSASGFAEELEMNLPMIVYNGALIKNAFTGEILLHQPIPVVLIKKIIDYAKERKVYLQLYIDDNLIIEKYQEETQLYMDIAGVDYQEVGDFANFPLVPSTKLMMIGDSKRIAAVEEELKGLYGNELSFMQSRPYFLEIIHPNVSKGKALEVLAEKHGILREEIIAVGDSFNDIGMIRYAGMGVAVANARDALKVHADYITTKERNLGVEEAIAKFILDSE